MKPLQLVTPLIQFQSFSSNNVFIKLEGMNLYGSAKDRAANYVINKLWKLKEINKNTEIVESSSGNMGIALAAVCQRNKLKCTIFIDKSITPINEFLIKSYGAKTIKATKCDKNGSYLINRINLLKEYINNRKNIYWFNQYGNPYVVEAYEKNLGQEIINQMPHIDYVFVAVSSGGTICGISKALHGYDEKIKIIAVDVEGSKLFNEKSKLKKTFTGIGSSTKSINFKKAIFEDYIIVDEKTSKKELLSTLKNEQLFLGESSGCVIAGARSFINKNKIKNKNIILISHDKGDRYFDVLYKTKGE